MRLGLEPPEDYLWGDHQFISLDEVRARTDKAFYQYLLLAYQAYMQGDADRITELELALQQRFDDDDRFLESEVQRFDDLNNAIVERIGLLEKDAGT